MFGDDTSSLLYRVAKMLLDDQYVMSPWVRKMPLKVVLGAGMGLNWAGDVADLVMYILFELTWATKPSVAKDFSVHVYLRYRDDILVCGTPHPTADGEHGVGKLISELIRRAASTELLRGGQTLYIYIYIYP